MIDDDVREQIVELDELAPLHNAAGARGDRRRPSGASRTCRTSPSSTRRSTRRFPTQASTYAVPRAWRERVGHPPLRLPRPLRRSGAAERVPVAAARRLPPRRRLLGDRRPRRPVGRHDDGLHAARGRADGDALGLGRPGRAALSARRAAVSTRLGSSTRSTSSPVCSALGGGRRRHARARGRARCRRPQPSSPSTSSCTASPARSRRWRGRRRARRARLHRRDRRGLGARPRRVCARLRFLGVEPRLELNSAAFPTATSAPPAPPFRCSSSALARSSSPRVPHARCWPVREVRTFRSRLPGSSRWRPWRLASA